MTVIERAEQRLAEEERQHELGADNRYDLHYWAAYLDGAREQKKEGGELAMSALNYVERQGFVTGMDYAGMTAEERETLLKEFRNLPVGPVAPLVIEHDYAKIVRCRECKWYGIYYAKKDGTPDKRYNPSVCLRGNYAKRRDPDWYCADGEREVQDADT